ncbi:MAG: metallophosphoesterase [Alphaproteobacteria bacterium]|nr:metallophosphoesterase [Alphaproteobacteria bacterium]
MPTKLVHISDLHFAARDADQPAALARSIESVAPDAIVVTGDLTRNGRRAEFDAAGEFLGGLSAPKLVVPGNHDIPVFHPMQRALSPFSRFAAHFGSADLSVQETPDVLIVGMNTAYGYRLGLDWSLGRISARGLARVLDALRTRKAGRLAIVACHHPLCPNPVDGQRSRTSGGPAAFAALAEAGMDILLHGHLHRALVRRHAEGPTEICANTALSDRERDGASGYNAIVAESGNWQLSTVSWRDGVYAPDSSRASAGDGRISPRPDNTSDYSRLDRNTSS